MNYIKLAKQTDGAWGGGVDWTWEELEEFAALVAAQERRECAKLCAEVGAWALVQEIEARGEV